jgi:hypothetical protein
MSISFWELIKEKKIIIPIIQRDYAQGRTNPKVNFIRDKFLDTLFDACSTKKLVVLDYIYGELGSDNESLFYPFDGQQRLTTLFLLHWYAAARQGILPDVASHFLNFRYEVRDGSRIFVENLANCQISKDHPVFLPYSEENSISSSLIDQSWYRNEWEFDPTVSGMLVMLDSIHGKFNAIEDLWGILTSDNPPICFNFQILKSLSLTGDEIFIKINSRGKQLTEFEQFKARFIDYLSQNNISNNIIDISKKFDNKWINLFWSLTFKDGSKEKNVDHAIVADQYFMSFLRYVAEIYWRWPSQDSTESVFDNSENSDLCYQFEHIISKNNTEIYNDGFLSFLIKILDKLSDWHSNNNNDCLDSFFSQFLVVAPDSDLSIDENKIRLFNDKKYNLFEVCCISKLTNTNDFSFKQKLMLFSLLLFLINDIKFEFALLRLRAIRNLLEHSYLWDKPFPQQLLTVSDIIKEGNLPDKGSFNIYQIKEEKEKIKLRTDNYNNSDLLKSLNYLENHILLRGRLSVFRQINGSSGQIEFSPVTLTNGRHFLSKAFDEDQGQNCDALIRGLLSQGDYAWRKGAYKQYRYLGGDKESTRENYNWRHIFTTDPEEPEFLKRREVIQSLAQKTLKCENKDQLVKKLNSISDEWLVNRKKEKKFDWRYYFVQYRAMRPVISESSGIYYWRYTEHSFCQLQLSKERLSSSLWSPFLWAAVCEAGHRDNWGDDGKGEEGAKPFLFKKLNLALWWSEFSWRIGSQTWDRALGTAQANFLDKIRAEFNEIDENGWLHIPGIDSVEGINYIDYSNNQFRKYDTVDRIKKIIPIIKFMFEL